MRYPEGAVYVASAYARREDARDFARELRVQGIRVVSTWHDLPPVERETEGDLPLTAQQAIAATCLREVDEAAWVLALGHVAMRGALWECGYAMGRGKVVWWVGLAPTLFASLAVRR